MGWVGGAWTPACSAGGGPVVGEVKAPRRRTVDLEAVARLVNASGSVEVEGLRLAGVEDVVAIKEDRVAKTYRVLVRFGSPVEDGKFQMAVASLVGRPIAQRTPVRVSHRRAGSPRGGGGAGGGGATPRRA